MAAIDRNLDSSTTSESTSPSTPHLSPNISPEPKPFRRTTTLHFTTLKQPSGRIRQPSSAASPLPPYQPPAFPVSTPPSWGGRDRALGGMFAGVLERLHGRSCGLRCRGVHVKHSSRQGARNGGLRLFPTGGKLAVTATWNTEPKDPQVTLLTYTIARNAPTLGPERMALPRKLLNIGAAPGLADDQGQGRTAPHACVFKALRSQNPDTPRRVPPVCAQSRWYACPSRVGLRTPWGGYMVVIEIRLRRPHARSCPGRGAHPREASAELVIR